MNPFILISYLALSVQAHTLISSLPSPKPTPVATCDPVDDFDQCPCVTGARAKSLGYPTFSMASFTTVAWVYDNVYQVEVEFQMGNSITKASLSSLYLTGLSTPNNYLNGQIELFNKTEKVDKVGTAEQHFSVTWLMVANKDDSWECSTPFQLVYTWCNKNDGSWIDGNCLNTKKSFYAEYRIECPSSGLADAPNVCWPRCCGEEPPDPETTENDETSIIDVSTGLSTEEQNLESTSEEVSTLIGETSIQLEFETSSEIPAESSSEGTNVSTSEETEPSTDLPTGSEIEFEPITVETDTTHPITREPLGDITASADFPIVESTESEATETCSTGVAIGSTKSETVEESLTQSVTSLQVSNKVESTTGQETSKQDSTELPLGAVPPPVKSGAPVSVSSEPLGESHSPEDLTTEELIESETAEHDSTEILIETTIDTAPDSSALQITESEASKHESTELPVEATESDKSQLTSSGGYSESISETTAGKSIPETTEQVPTGVTGKLTKSTESTDLTEETDLEATESIDLLSTEQVSTEVLIESISETTIVSFESESGAPLGGINISNGSITTGDIEHGTISQEFPLYSDTIERTDVGIPIVSTTGPTLGNGKTNGNGIQSTTDAFESNSIETEFESLSFGNVYSNIGETTIDSESQTGSTSSELSFDEQTTVVESTETSLSYVVSNGEETKLYQTEIENQLTSDGSTLQTDSTKYSEQLPITSANFNETTLLETEPTTNTEIETSEDSNDKPQESINTEQQEGTNDSNVTSSLDHIVTDSDQVESPSQTIESFYNSISHITQLVSFSSSILPLSSTNQVSNSETTEDAIETALPLSNKSLLTQKESSINIVSLGATYYTNISPTSNIAVQDDIISIEALKSYTPSVETTTIEISYITTVTAGLEVQTSQYISYHTFTSTNWKPVEYVISKTESGYDDYSAPSFSTKVITITAPHYTYLTTVTVPFSEAYYTTKFITIIQNQTTSVRTLIIGTSSSQDEVEKSEESIPTSRKSQTAGDLTVHEFHIQWNQYTTDTSTANVMSDTSSSPVATPSVIPINGDATANLVIPSYSSIETFAASTNSISTPSFTLAASQATEIFVSMPTNPSVSTLIDQSTSSLDSSQVVSTYEASASCTSKTIAMLLASFSLNFLLV